MNADALAGLFVVDMATMMAGPHSAMMLADFGATVLKVESPEGDPSRRSPWKVNGTSVYWRQYGRNKEAITLNLKDPRGRDTLLKLLDKADVLIENMRPGKLEALGLAPQELHSRNRGLIILRVTGWGQFGPYKDQACFGTQAESMSGFTHMNGQPDGPPTLPPVTIADGAAGYLGAFAVLAAVYRRDHDPDHRGQVIDLSLFEALFSMFGPHAAAHDQFGVIPGRKGSRSTVGAPRNLYRCRDDRWVGISAAAEQIVPRLFAAIGRPELYQDERFSNVTARLANIDELDRIIGEWMARHDSKDVIEILLGAGATASPVYDISDIFADPHFTERQVIAPAPTHDGNPIRMTNVAPKLTETPGKLRWSGRALGADNESWLMGKLGLSREQFEAFKRDGVISS